MTIGISFLSPLKSLLGFEVSKGIEPMENDNRLFLQKNVRFTIGLIFCYFDLTFNTGRPLPFEEIASEFEKLG